jgi:hypothetical protein
MLREDTIESDLLKSVEPLLKHCFGLNVSAALDGLATLQTYTNELARRMAALSQFDWVAAKRRLDELPTKSKQVMVLAASKGWFFGWHESIGELIALVERLSAIEDPYIDDCLSEYYRNNLNFLTDELVEKYPNRATVIMAAVRAHGAFGSDGYFLSIPVFIAQADGLLTEIAGVKSATMRASGNTPELLGSKAVREKLGTDLESLDLVHPILKLHELDFMKSTTEREKTAQTSGKPFAALNRHQVIHGESWDYGTEINSLKAFSFLAFAGLHLPMILDSPLRTHKLWQAAMTPGLTD